MATVYHTKDGDVLDLICHRHYGDEHGTTEAVLAANPGLADQPVVLPLGLDIILPDLVAAETVTEYVRLWG